MIRKFTQKREIYIANKYALKIQLVHSQRQLRQKWLNDMCMLNFSKNYNLFSK